MLWRQEQAGERSIREDRQIDKATGRRAAQRAEAARSLHRRRGQSYAEEQRYGGKVRRGLRSL